MGRFNPEELRCFQRVPTPSPMYSQKLEAWVLKESKKLLEFHYVSLAFQVWTGLRKATVPVFSSKHCQVCSDGMLRPKGEQRVDAVEGVKSEKEAEPLRQFGLRANQNII